MKTVVIGISGGIAAFKAIQLTSDLVKKGYNVEVIMTKNALEFVQPLTIESLTKNKVMIDMFDRNFEYKIGHISIAKKADCFIIVPATANIIAKVAHGIADDMLTTTFLASTCPKLIAPAMNTAMYENPITINNINICKLYGMQFIEPTTGFLACGDSGKGKLADLDYIMENIEKNLFNDNSLNGKKVLVTAGPTIEPIDPVRFITNHSSGKMGYEIARMASFMGAEVCLISGPTNIKPPYDIELINIKTADEMFNAIKNKYQDYDYIIKAAAVGDYKVKEIAKDKIKKNENELNISFIKNQDILSYLGENKKENQVICGFAMETTNLIENATNKLLTKNCDMIVANNLLVEGAGFKNDTNVVSIITKDKAEDLELMSKKDLAVVILNKIQELKD